jgi:chain length determinant protein (polysaccharide antigen chain regulator)
MPKTESNSAAETDQPQSPQYVQYAPPYAQPFEDDTIDLYELWITLWSKRWLVIGVTAVAAIGSVVFALLQPPVYKAEALLLPPKAKDVQSLNVKGVQGASAAGVFAAFNKNLSSRSLQKKFIKEYGLMELLAPERTPETRDEDIYKGFAEMIKIETKGSTSVSIELHDPEVAAQWVNDYIKFMDSETIRLLVEYMRNSITNRIRDIEYTIGSKRQMAKQRREDKINLFQEASTIAVKLGVKDRVDATNVVQNNQLNISTASTPLYYRGFRALKAEITILKNRKSDDPFIVGLRDLQESLALLRSIKIEDEGLHAVSIDQAAYPPKNRIKPNRRLIVSLGTVVGLFLGIFLVFFVSFIQNQKETHSA